jgi:hypothetical protein
MIEKSLDGVLNIFAHTACSKKYVIKRKTTT